jgi:hypothetical protein
MMFERLRRFTYTTLSDRFTPLALGLVCLLAYGLLLAWQGFYWDDFPLIWISQTYGLDGLARYFSTNRPFWGLLYQASNALLGDQPWQWQVFGLFWRWVSAVTFWLLLRQIWPRQQQAIALASLALLVYPGFGQQAIGMVYGHFFLVLALFFFSLSSGLRALQGGKRAWIWFSGALVASFVNLITLEYFFLLELVRPLLYGLVHKGNPKPYYRTLRAWLPYLLLFIAVIIWRAFFFTYQTQNYTTSGLEALQVDPLGGGLAFLASVLTQIARAGIGAWVQPFMLPDLAELGRVNAIIFVFVSLAGAGLTTWLLVSLQDRTRLPDEANLFPGSKEMPSSSEGAVPTIRRTVTLQSLLLNLRGLCVSVVNKILRGKARQPDEAYLYPDSREFHAKPIDRSYPINKSGSLQTLNNYLRGLCVSVVNKFNRSLERKALWQPGVFHNDAQTARQMLVLGAFLLVVAGVPFYLTGLPVRLGFPNDRFTLPFIPGSALLLTGLLYSLPLRKHWPRLLVAALLFGLAIGHHFANSTAYRRDWNVQKAFFWQLSWRAPGLVPGTTLVTNDLPLRFYSDNSLTAPLNWIYAPANHSQAMDYMLFYSSVRLKDDSRVALTPGLPIEVDYLAATFSGSTDQVVVLYYQPPACLRILDGGIEQDNQFLPVQIRMAAVYLGSNAWILPEPADPAIPPRQYYGPEPARGWCYYYQKADLARQRQDWEQVAALGDQAFSLGDYPNDPAERLPFIEGYAHLERWQDALEQTRLAAQISPAIHPALCRLWQRIDQDFADRDERQDIIQQVSTEIACTFEDP